MQIFNLMYKHPLILYLEAGLSLFHPQLLPRSVLLRLVHGRHGITFVSGRRHVSTVGAVVVVRGCVDTEV